MKPPIPILLSVRSLGIGGCERDLTKLAVSIDRARFTPHVAFFKEGFQLAELSRAGVPLLHLDVASFMGRSAWAGGSRLRAYLKQHEICLSHAYDVPLSLFTAPVARLAGVPVVVTSALGSRALFSQRERTLLKLSDRLSDRIVVNSEAMRRELETTYGAPPDKLFVCHNGYRPEVFFPPTGGRRLRPRGLEDAEVVVGSVCALRPEKNLSLLLRAFAQVRQPGVKLLIVGSGPEESRLKAEVRDQAMEDHVVFEPATPDVAEWLRAIDVFVLASISESFPNALLEAMASGCAVVASRVGGVPELVTADTDGLLFESQNVHELVSALARVVSSTELRKQLGDSAAQRALERFTMSAYCSRIEAFYLSQLAAKGVR